MTGLFAVGPSENAKSSLIKPAIALDLKPPHIHAKSIFVGMICTSEMTLKTFASTYRQTLTRTQVREG